MLQRIFYGEASVSIPDPKSTLIVDPDSNAKRGTDLFDRLMNVHFRYERPTVEFSLAGLPSVFLLHYDHEVGAQAVISSLTGDYTYFIKALNRPSFMEVIRLGEETYVFMRPLPKKTKTKYKFQVSLGETNKVPFQKFLFFLRGKDEGLYFPYASLYKSG